MAKHKVSELEGALLDAAVAKAEGCCVEYRQYADGDNLWLVSPRPDVVASLPDNYSTDWRDGGPIIERERIAPQPERRGDIGNEWADQPEPALGWEVHLGGRTITGPTYLIAAMRAYCASRFGEEVELP